MFESDDLETSTEDEVCLKEILFCRKIISTCYDVLCFMTSSSEMKFFTVYLTLFQPLEERPITHQDIVKDMLVLEHQYIRTLNMIILV